jgi:hypothetical protein
MAVVSTMNLQLKITDGTFNSFNTGQSVTTLTNFTQLFSVDILVPTATINQQISIQGLNMAQQVFFWSDSAVGLTFVPEGSLLSGTPALILLPTTPSVIAVQNIIAIYVSNQTGQQARIILQGAGI